MPGWNECLQSRLSTQAQAGCARFYLFPSFWYIFPHLQTGAFQQVPNLPFTVSGTSFCYQGWDVARWEKNLLSRSDFLVWCTWMALLFCLTFLTRHNCLKVHLYSRTSFFTWIGVYHIFFNHSSIDEHLGLDALGTINNGAVNLEVQIFGTEILFPPNIFSGMKLLYGSSIFNFLGTSILSSIVAVPIYIHTNNEQMFLFRHMLSICYPCLLMTAI